MQRSSSQKKLFFWKGQWSATKSVSWPTEKKLLKTKEFMTSMFYLHHKWRHQIKRLEKTLKTFQYLGNWSTFYQMYFKYFIINKLHRETKLKERLKILQNTPCMLWIVFFPKDSQWRISIMVIYIKLSFQWYQKQLCDN